jgi:hypothetical protein
MILISETGQDSRQKSSSALNYWKGGQSMSPLYCDYSGKEITPQCGSTNPALGRDYYAFGNKIVSQESMEAIEDHLKNLMKSRGFGNYSFQVYQQLKKEIADKHITKGAKPRQGKILG